MVIKNIFFLEKNQKKIVIFFFSIIFFWGMTAGKDYGVSSDEYATRINGFINLNYIGQKINPEITNKFKKNKDIPDLLDIHERTYGAIFDTVASFIEVVFNIKDKHNQFILKHYLNFFIFFLSLVAFYKLCYLRFNDRKLSLLGVFFLTLSPRIFANSFYNNKDLIFLSFLLFSVYFGIKFFKKNNLNNAILFALANSLSIAGVRVYGLISPLIIYSLLIIFIFASKYKVKNQFTYIFTSFFLTIVFTIIFWPYLWESPIKNFIDTFKFMGNFSNYWQIKSLFLGKIISADSMPWYYTSLWIIITTPIFYTLLFFFGISNFLINIFNNFKKNFNTKEFYYDVTFISIFFISIMSSIIFSSFSFNGWRHLYFIYPYFIIFCLIGYKKIIHLVNKEKLYFKIINIFTFLTIIFYSSWIIFNHPHQYAYFNFLVGKNIYKKFDIDYWGLSYKENLIFIAENDKREKIYIKNNSKNKLFYPLLSLEKKLEKKFIWDFNNREPDYIITNYYLDKTDYTNNFMKKYFVYRDIMVNGSSVNTVFKKK